MREMLPHGTLLRSVENKNLFVCVTHCVCHTFVCIFICVCIHVYAYTYAYCMYIYVYVCTCKYIISGIFPYIHTYIHTYIQCVECSHTAHFLDMQKPKNVFVCVTDLCVYVYAILCIHIRVRICIHVYYA